MNVATYGPGGRFAMTDRGRTALRQSADTLQIGPSQMHWTGSKLVISVNEIGGLPAVGRIRGTITLTPRAVTSVELPLSEDGAHVWRPFAPLAQIDVDLDGAGWRWQGEGYFDANFGTRALEADFDYWTWGCFPDGPNATAFYDLRRRDGTHSETAVRFDETGRAEVVSAPARTPFARSLWQVHRETRADPGTVPRQTLNMLDAPFYSRAAVTTQLNGRTVEGVHEALDLRRFRSPLIKPMLAVRVPRRAGWTFPDR